MEDKKSLENNDNGQYIFCHKCGTKNLGTDSFCSNCGTSLKNIKAEEEDVVRCPKCGYEF